MSKKNRKAWRASVQRAKKGTVPVSAGDNTSELQSHSGGDRDCPPPPHKLRGLARREWIDQQAQQMYQRHVGDTLDLCVESCKHTAAAFNSQMREARGEGQAWGPDVTPYENRMTGSLLARLLREKRTWLREFRQQIEQALKDEAALEDEQAEAQAATSARQAGDGPAPQVVRAPEADPDTAAADPEFAEPVPELAAAHTPAVAVT